MEDRGGFENGREDEGGDQQPPRPRRPAEPGFPSHQVNIRNILSSFQCFNRITVNFTLLERCMYPLFLYIQLFAYYVTEM